MKKLMSSLLPGFLCICCFSQDLVIKSGSKGLYLEHKVAPKEGLFPIGRLYNVHPRHIANFNGLDFNKGLSIGQQINIPLTDTNFKQTVNKGIPVYYRTIDKESLANISVKNKVQIASLRAWNDIPGDNISAGTKVIVGFLVTNEMQNRVVIISSKNPGVEPSVSNVSKVEAQKKQLETEPPKEDKAKTADSEPSVSNVSKVEAQKKKLETEPGKEATSKTEGGELSVSNVAKAEEQKKQLEGEPRKDETSKPDPNKTPGAAVDAPSKNEEKKTDSPVVRETPKKDDPAITRQSGAFKEDGTGYFRSNFYQQIRNSPLKKDQTLTSSIFKTTTGWQDGKYYLLINGVEPGTIVKLTNPSNNKVVFAKVLYSMDKIRENQGVDVRISDAAAASLAVTETDKFILKVNY